MKSQLYKDKKIFAFDVDGTLSLSRSKIDQEMVEFLKKLLLKVKVAIISGGAFKNIKRQVLDEIGFKNKLNKNLILLPENGSNFYIFNGVWKNISSNKLTKKDREKIIKAIKEVDKEDTELRNNKSYGKEIQDRGSEITYSALGEKAPIRLKHTWDPNFKKRIILQNKLAKKLPDFEVKIGGTTSIDITLKGIDKAYGIRKLIDYLKLQKKDILFFGDAVYKNGNDYPVFLMNVDTIKVFGPQETKTKLAKMLK